MSGASRSRAAAAAALSIGLAVVAQERPRNEQDKSRAAVVGLFHARGFPTIDAREIARATLDEALSGLPVVAFDSPRALVEGLRPRDVDVLLLPHGSAFPLEAWPAIRRFLKGGGGLVALGGAPFTQPVRQVTNAEGNAAYVLGVRQPSFAHDLLIGPAEPVQIGELKASTRVTAVEGSEWDGALPMPTRSYALTVRLATRKDLPDEHGSEGPRDAVLRPLVHVVDADGLPRACPLLAIDRLRGDDAGGRWVLAPSDAEWTAPMIRQAVSRALEGAAQLEARPVRASVEPGDKPAIRVVVRRPVLRTGEAAAERALLRVRSEANDSVWSGEVALVGPPQERTALATLEPAVPLAPGLYHVEASVPDASWRPRTTTTGFWVKDAQLLATGPRLSVSRDWIRSDGRVMPVIGTTYMAADAHRKFLFEPNPHVWDRDFREMSRLGVNLVRTGLWTAWSRAMLDPGAVDEGVLSALEAYVMTAARHRVLVCFTFFAFQPPAFGGSNPFLDPRSLEGQRAFLTLVASRFRGVPWVHWDLINEPSYAPGDELWTNQPVGDVHERKAWSEWLLARHGQDEVALRDSWRAAGDGLFDLPERRDLGWSMVREGRLPRKAFDFAAFSQDVVARWAATLRETLRAAGGEALVTLGQDEGGAHLRPAQQLHAGSVDYTAVHTWWNNDDLLWDGVVTKTPERPNLHQETGLMRLEDADGNPWRTTEAAARLLERKLAYAFASRGAGVVQWAWNVNPYQPIDNEAVIGLFRPDGTAKPELRALTDLAGFLATSAPWLDDFEPDPVVLVIPHARLFSGRPGDLDATRRVVRILAERFGVVPMALSDQRLTAERLASARLAILSAPEVVEDAAARALQAARQAGTLLLVTGAVEGDGYGRTGEALAALGIDDPGRPLAQHERTRWAGGWATFDGLLGERLRRSSKPEPSAPTAGMWHEPLPLEFARETEPLAALLGAALRAAAVGVHESDTHVAARLLRCKRAVLAVCVNETAVDARRRLTIEGRGFEIPVPAGRARLALFERGSARLLATTPGPDVARARP
ncbi:MAG TPA: hypothetical protein VKA01_14825 [Vicinamibacteria bacterium]|nr:hypothetical protein [Vicinamibacteria bacterium]